jgi:hypothetical protein
MAAYIKYHENLLIRGNESSGSMKDGEFLDWLTDY